MNAREFFKHECLITFKINGAATHDKLVNPLLHISRDFFGYLLAHLILDHFVSTDHPSGHTWIRMIIIVIEHLVHPVNMVQ